MPDDKSCVEWQAQLSAHADGELAATDAITVAQHLSGCEVCSNEFNDLLRTMKTIHERMPPHKAPDALRARVRADLANADFGAASRRVSHARRRLERWLVAASLTVVAGGAYVAGAHWAPSPAPSLRDAVLTAHVRSLQAGHLTDVSSSDQHAVKPWFTGKLDFSPAVARLEPDGFPLVGGRLDYLSDRPVAALVYSRRAHIINVLTYPAATGGEGAPHLESRNGFQIASWTLGGMTYWVVSDLNADELRGFCSLLRDHVALP